MAIGTPEQQALAWKMFCLDVLMQVTLESGAVDMYESCVKIRTEVANQIKELNDSIQSS